MPSPDRRRLLGFVLTVVAAFAFGSSPLFAKPVYAAGVQPVVLLCWRFLIGASLSWAWLAIAADRRQGLRRLSRRSALVAFGLGALYVGNAGTYYAAIQTVPASLAALIVYVYPAIVAVFSLRVGRRLEGRRAWLGLAMALVGVVLAVGGIDPAARPPVVGLVLAIASPLIYSVWIVLSARFAGERQDRVGDASDGAEAAVASALMMTSTFVVFFLLATGLGSVGQMASVPGEAIPAVIGIGAISTFLAIQAFYSGTRRLGAAQASLVSTVEPIWTIVLAGLLFGERLQPVQLVGGTLILAAVVLSQTGQFGLRIARPQVRIADE